MLRERYAAVEYLNVCSRGQYIGTSNVRLLPLCENTNVVTYLYIDYFLKLSSVASLSANVQKTISVLFVKRMVFDITRNIISIDILTEKSRCENVFNL